MPLIYIAPFQNVPKIDLTDSGTAFSLTFYALNYSYLIDLPLIGYATGTSSSDLLLSTNVALSAPQFSLNCVDTSMTDNVVLTILDSVSAAALTTLTVNSTGDADTTDNVMLDNVEQLPITNLTLLNFTAITDLEYDPFWSNTVLLLSMDGADNGTVFTDAKGKVVSRLNTVTKIANPKFGASSAYFAGNGYLSLPNSTDFTFGAGNFTIEGWVYKTNTAQAVFFARRANSSSYGPILIYLGNGTLQVYMSSSGTLWDVTSGTTIASGITLNTWHHIAVVRSGTNLLSFLNGVLLSTKSIGSNALVASTSLSYIGGDSDTSFLTGYIDEFRVTKGAARYTADFAVPTAAFLKY